MSGAREAYAAGFRAFRRRKLGAAEEALSEAVEAGALALDHALEDAVTMTGYYRMLLSGGRPGRHDTGNMVSKIRTNAQTPERGGGRITMAFGWFAGDFEDYFREQDLGTEPTGKRSRGGIPPANALYANDGRLPGTAAEMSRDFLRSALARRLR